MTDIKSILKDRWGYDSFRPLQEEIIQSVLKGQDALALLPTGGGKSICFQVPAFARPGLCLVISPLIALMKDQVETLRKKNITAFSLHSGMTRKETIHTLSLAGGSNCKFLYVSPERLETALFKEYLPGLDINLIAVDEAHCISQWGYDFRPAYLRIAALREELPSVPVLALTASATEAVQQDICAKLLFRRPAIFRQSFERPNLSYSVFKTSSKINKILEILQNVPGCGIIYCKSRKRTKTLSDLLNMQGIAADYYHAGLNPEQRNKKQEDWLNNTTRVIVCTNAFGMGIDKPDVRTVIHADAPDCLENYYQEAGRAGRDGKRAYTVLLYQEKELEELKKLVALRFPPLAAIRHIYQALMNHLQIASGSGEGQYYEMDLHHFIKQFSLDAQETIGALKVLEQEEQLYFTEQVFALSKVEFVCGKQSLYAFEKDNPLLEPLIKTLLRHYEGIIDQPVPIMEQSIARTLRISSDEVKKGLRSLQAHGIIDYTPQKENPQLYLIRNRVKAQDLQIDIEAYTKRKEQFEERLDALLQYALSAGVCRSVIIGKYFGDDDAKACGICDNCLNAKKQTLDGKEFEDIRQRLLESIVPSGLPVKDALAGFSGAGKEKALKVIGFLQAEDKIEVNEEGWIRVK